MKGLLRKPISGLLFILLLHTLSAETITYTPYSEGDLITADGMNTRFSLVYDLLNGNLDNTNLASDPLSISEVSDGLMTIFGTNLGIGTSSPTEKLEVIGTVKATAFEGDGSALTNVPGTWSTNDTRIYYDSGYVGIGNTYPLAHLHLSGPGNVTSRIDNTGADLTVVLTAQSSGAGSYVGTTTDDPFSIVSNNNVRLHAAADGNIGIGTTSPAEALDVVGTVEADTVKAATYHGVPWRSPAFYVANIAYTTARPAPMASTEWGNIHFMVPHKVVIEGVIAGYDDQCGAGCTVSYDIWENDVHQTSTTSLTAYNNDTLNHTISSPVTIEANNKISISSLGGNSIADVIIWLYGYYSE